MSDATLNPRTGELTGPVPDDDPALYPSTYRPPLPQDLP